VQSNACASGPRASRAAAECRHLAGTVITARVLLRARARRFRVKLRHSPTHCRSRRRRNSDKRTCIDCSVLECGAAARPDITPVGREHRLGVAAPDRNSRHESFGQSGAQHRAGGIRQGVGRSLNCGCFGWRRSPAPRQAPESASRLHVGQRLSRSTFVSHRSRVAIAGAPWGWIGGICRDGYCAGTPGPREGAGSPRG
jgi:hypothetical protein